MITLQQLADLIGVEYVDLEFVLYVIVTRLLDMTWPWPLA